jgi:3-hydroxyacyl-[acyl-carrier-protein] dehydratase
MLLADLYQLHPISVQCADGKTIVEAEITLDRTHALFKGHFPDLPIMPGVCMVQLVKEVLEKHLDKKLFLASASNIKFLAVLNPEIHSNAKVEIQLMPAGKGSFEIESKLYFGETIFFKMKAGFLDESVMGHTKNALK